MSLSPFKGLYGFPFPMKWKWKLFPIKDPPWPLSTSLSRFQAQWPLVLLTGQHLCFPASGSLHLLPTLPENSPLLFPVCSSLSSSSSPLSLKHSLWSKAMIPVHKYVYIGLLIWALLNSCLYSDVNSARARNSVSLTKTNSVIDLVHNRHSDLWSTWKWSIS